MLYKGLQNIDAKLNERTCFNYIKQGQGNILSCKISYFKKNNHYSPTKGEQRLI